MCFLVPFNQDLKFAFICSFQTTRKRPSFLGYLALRATRTTRPSRCSRGTRDADIQTFYLTTSSCATSAAPPSPSSFTCTATAIRCIVSKYLKSGSNAKSVRNSCPPSMSLNCTLKTGIRSITSRYELRHTTGPIFKALASISSAICVQNLVQTDLP